MNANSTFKLFFSFVALVAILISMAPNASACLVLSDNCARAQMPAACCAPVEAGTSVILNDCCCRPSPIDTAVTPGLIAFSPTPFTHFAVLPPLHALSDASTVRLLQRGTTVQYGSAPKIYLLKRSLLI